jgi:hydroxysqualene synthase
MTITANIDSSKTEHEENFPVASILIAPRLRAPILSFYRFARAADDVADHATLSESEKFARLDALEDTLRGRADAAREALPLRRVLAENGLAPTHPLDLLTAFRADVTKRRYADWAELMHYCRYSAMPVGRFVLDLHGEERSTWAYSDPLCAGLQVINHLQDCAKDYRALDRVYLPLDSLTAHGIGVDALAAPNASPALRSALSSIAVQTGELLPQASKLPLAVKDARLGLETGVIVRLAQKLIALLMTRDPLSERVHLTKAGAVLQAARGTATTLVARLALPRASSRAGT